MATFGSLKPREILRALHKGGFYIHEQSGSPVQMKHPTKSGRVTVPNHSRFDVPKAIVRSIIRQAGLSSEEFIALLDQ